ncbi:unnamed protein product [Caenorhabditis nigoni]
MPINLLKLPRLVGVIVVSELSDYQEVFLLSICSRRTYSLVKKAKIKIPKLAFRFADVYGCNTFDIGVVTGSAWLPVTSVLHDRNSVLIKTLTTFGYEADADFFLWREEAGKILHRIKCANEPMEIQKTLQDHINSIFHYFDTNKLYVSMRHKRSLPNITNVKEMEIEHITVDPTLLKNVLTTYPDTQSVSVFSSIVGDIPNDSPFFQIQNFYVPYGASSCGPDYIHKFAGRNLCLGRVTCTVQDIIQFLRKWISHEAYYNLETMIIETEATINQDLIRQSIEYEEYDPNEPEKRPEFLFFDIPYISSTPKQYSVRNQDFVEIKRITDGKRAFFAIDDSFLLLEFLVHKN